MACSIIRDRETGDVVQVLAPNGEPSLLFANALTAFGDDSNKALRAWAYAYTPGFKLKYGDWEKGQTIIPLDPNGEPVSDAVLYTPENIQRTINTRHATWEEFQEGSDGWVPEDKAIRFKGMLEKRYPGIIVDLMRNSSMPGQAKPIYKSSLKPIAQKFTPEEIRKQQESVNVILDKLVSKFPGLNYEWVSASSLKPSEHYFPINGIRAYVKDNKIYLVKGRVTPEVAIEEVMHVFIEALRQDRPQLFKGLFDNTIADPKYQADYINIRDWYKDNYKGEGLEDTIKSEFLAKTMAKAMRSELEITPEGRPLTLLGKLIKRFLDWLASVLGTERMLPGMAIQNIVEVINTNEIQLDLPKYQYMYYSADNLNPIESDDRDATDLYAPEFKGKSVRDLNIEKAKIELEKLKKIKSKIEKVVDVNQRTAQLNVINKFIENVQQKLDVLEQEQPESTISVSKYKGTTELNPDFDKVTELGANFGNFFHKMMEELQNDYMETGKNPIEIFSDPAWFDAFYEKNKRLINFKNLDVKTLRSIAANIAADINQYALNGSILLPEIGLSARDVDGQLVIGRFDLTVVSRTGNIEIIDLKTKRIKTVQTNKFSDVPFKAKTSSFNRPQYSSQPVGELRDIVDRSPLNEYQIQLNMYAEIARSMGLNVAHRTAYVIAYDYNANNDDLKLADEFTFRTYAVGKFTDEDFYTYDGKGPDPNLSSDGNKIDAAVRARFVVNSAAEERQAAADKNNPFALLREDDQRNIINRLLELSLAQLDALEQESRDIDKNTGLTREEKETAKDRLKSRKTAILSIRERLNPDAPQLLTGENPEEIALGRALLIKAALDTFSQEIKNIGEIIQSIDVPAVYEFKSEENRKALKQLADQIRNMDLIAAYIQAFDKTVKNLDLDAESKNNILTPVNQMLQRIEIAKSKYFNTTRGVVKSIILNTMGPTKWQAVFGDVHKMLKPRLDWILNTIEKYEKGQGDTLGEASYKITNMLHRIIGGAKNNPERIAALKKEAEDIQKLMEINKLDDKSIDAYLDAQISGQESAFYMGSTMSGNKNIVEMSDIIASNMDSELIINVMYQYMRNITEDGKNEFLNWAYATDIDNLKSAFAKVAGGMEQANALITEEAQVATNFDETGKVTETELQRMFLLPFTLQYKQEYDSYEVRLKSLGNRINELKSRIDVLPAGEEKTALENERKELYNQKNELFKDFTEWKIKYTQTEVKPEIMRLMNASGAYNQEISEAYSKIISIINFAGGPEFLTEDQQDQIDELEAFVSRKRQELYTSASPEEIEKLDLLLDNFKSELNINLWTVRREQVLRESGEEAVKTWDMNNSDLVPRKSWQRKKDFLYEQLAKINGNNEELQELYRRRSKIKARTQVRGIWNVKYLQERDIAELDAIERDIEAIKATSKKELSREDQETRNSIYTQLKYLQKEDLADSYKREKAKLKKDVINAYSIYRQKKNDLEKIVNPTTSQIADRNQALDEYLKKEQAYADFYNKNNNNRYEVGQNILVLNKPFEESPKAYLRVLVPQNPNDMELVPNKKYRYRRLKEEAYNPDYQESFEPKAHSQGMYPMPKGMRFNTDTKRFDIAPGAQFANPKFLALQANKAAEDFYTKWVVEEFLMKQKLASGRPLGYRYPFVKQLALENIINKGATGVAREFKEKAQELMYSESKFEQATNESGMSGVERIKFPENYAVPAELTTTNGIEAIVNWNKGFYLNRQLAGISVEMTAVDDFLDNLIRTLQTETREDLKPVVQQRVAQLEKIRDIIDFNKRKFVHGQVWEKEDNPNKWLNRKSLRIIMQAAAFGRMAFDIPMQLGNMLSGNVQAFLSLSDSRHANSDDFLYAKRAVYTRFFPKMIADYGKIAGVSYETMLYRLMNPTQKDLERTLDANTASKARRLANRVFSLGDLSMSLQDKGEIEIGLSTMLAILHNRKYKVFEVDESGEPIIRDGAKVFKTNAQGEIEEVSGVDAFAIHSNGTFGPRKDVNISDKDVEDLRGTIMLEVTRFQGNYAANTKTRFGATTIGSLAEFYRKYLIPAISARFGGAFNDGGYKGVGSAYSWDAGEAYMGYYIALNRMVQYYGFPKAAKTLLYDTLLPGFVKRRFKMDSDVEDYYRGRAAMAGREILLALGFYMLYNALRASLMDSDEDDLTYAELMMFRALVKVSNESRSMTPVPIIGKPQDYIQQFGQFTTAFREGETLWNMMENALWYADYEITGRTFAYERGFYQRDTDRYEQGDAKIWKNLSDLSGYSNIVDVFDPYEAAKKAVKPK